MITAKPVFREVWLGVPSHDLLGQRCAVNHVLTPDAARALAAELIAAATKAETKREEPSA